MLAAVEEDYGMMGKRKWIKEAIADLVKTDMGLASVGLGEHYEVHDAQDVVIMDMKTVQRLEAAMTMIRRQDPLFEGVQSAVIRAAIRMRLNSRKNTK